MQSHSHAHTHQADTSQVTKVFHLHYNICGHEGCSNFPHLTLIYAEKMLNVTLKIAICGDVFARPLHFWPYSVTKSPDIRLES